MTGIFLSILGISASVGVMVILLMLLKPFLNKRYAAKWKYLIWIFLALRLLIPFGGANGQSAMDRSPQENRQRVSGTEEKNTDNSADRAMAYSRLIVQIPPEMTAPIHVMSEKNNTGVAMADAAAFVWIIGSLIFISVHFISYFYYRCIF